MKYKILNPVVNQLLGALAAILVIWLTIRMIRGNPMAFNRESLSKSFFTIGVLTLMLIAFVAICVWILRNYT